MHPVVNLFNEWIGMWDFAIVLTDFMTLNLILGALRTELKVKRLKNVNFRFDEREQNGKWNFCEKVKFWIQNWEQYRKWNFDV